MGKEGNKVSLSMEEFEILSWLRELVNSIGSISWFIPLVFFGLKYENGLGRL